MTFEFTSDSEQKTERLNELELPSVSCPFSRSQSLHKLCHGASVNTNMQNFLETDCKVTTREIIVNNKKTMDFGLKSIYSYRRHKALRCSDQYFYIIKA